MKFQPMSDEDIARMNLIQPGQYQYEVISADEKTSAKGNEMIVAQLKIWDQDGKERRLTDWLMPSFPKKLKHFCKASNLLDKYELGDVSAIDCLNKSGVVEIAITKNNKNEDWNSVTDYLPYTGATKVVKKEEPFFNDDLPF